MNKKLNTIIDIYEPLSKLDDKLFNLLSDKIYDKYVSPLRCGIEDMAFMILFGKTYWEVHEAYNTPGDDDGTKPVLWDNGYPPEQIIDYLNNKDIKKEEKIKKLKAKIKLIKKTK